MFPKNRIIVPLMAFALLAIVLTACATAQPITETSWKWTGTTAADSSSDVLVPNPANYTLTLLLDGSLSIKNDCNNVGGSYQLSGSDLTITLGASTLAYCGDASLDMVFIDGLSRIESYQLDNGRLVLLFAGGEGQMTFEQ